MTSAACSTTRIALREWESVELPLEPVECVRLAELAGPVLNVAREIHGNAVLTARHYVGRIRLGHLEVLVEPKIPIPSLLALLAEVHDGVELLPPDTGYATSRDIADLLPRMFLTQVEILVRQGLRKSYVPREETLLAVRGRPDVQGSLRLTVRADPRVHCHFEELTLDGPENRLLLSALTSIASNPCLPVVRRKLAHRLMAELPEVKQSHLANRVIELPPPDRVTRGYRPALWLAKLIIEGTGIERGFGSTQASSFVVDMNRVFELYLRRRLSRLLAPEGIEVEYQPRFPFDEQAFLQLRPDFLFVGRNRLRVVGDAKYRADSPITPGELYQVFTYCSILRAQRGFIFRAGPQPHQTFRVRDGKTVIEALGLDLSGSSEAIGRDMLGIARRVCAACAKV